MYRLTHLLLAGLLFPIVILRAADAPAPDPLAAYAAVGSSFVHDNHLAQLGWNDAQVEAFLRGVRAGFSGQRQPPDAAMQELLEEIGRRMQQVQQEEKRRRFSGAAFARPGYLQAYLKQMQTRFALQASDTGLCFGLKDPGFGARPEPGDTVIVSYKATAADTETDLPGIGGERQRVKVSDLVPGLSELLQMMALGSSAMAIVPPDLSYGSGEWPSGTERGTPIIFTVILHEIVNPQAAP